MDDSIPVIPPVIGWAAAGGALDERAAALFALQFFWQLPHFLALGWMYREDYRRGGCRVLAVEDPDGSATGRQMCATAGLLLAVSLAPYGLGLAGGAYLAAAATAGLAFLWTCLRAARALTEASARGVFAASLAYLPIVLGALVCARR